ncbi:MAG: immunity 17 family protein [Burkholderiales bacterium]|nr:immunity 17 family protein [Burkholderiales bacterium]
MEPAFLFFAGLFCMAGAALDWSWFFDNWRAKPFVEALGREGARLFYVALGTCLMSAAYYMR